MPFSGLVFVPFLLIEKEPKRSSEKISSNRIFSLPRAVNPEGACLLGQSLHQWKPQASSPDSLRGAGGCARRRSEHRLALDFLVTFLSRKK